MRYFVEAKNCQTGAEIVEDPEGGLWMRHIPKMGFVCFDCGHLVYAGWVSVKEPDTICDECLKPWG